MLGIAKCLGLSPVVAPAQLEDASMDRIVGGILVFLLGMTVVAADDEDQDKQSATPEQQYKSLLMEYNDAFQEYATAYRKAKTPEEQQQVVQEKYPWPDKYASKFLELAAKNPKEPFAEAALIWIMTNEYELLRFRPWYEHTARYEMIRIMTGGGRRWGVPSKEEQDIRSRATDMLLRDHVASPKLARVVEMLGSSQDKKSATLLRAILDKNANTEVKAEACMALARQMQARVALVKQLKNDPQAAKSVEQNYGKDYVEELQKADLAKLETEAEQRYTELTEQYLPEMKPASVAMLCQQLHYTNDSETLLRVLYTRGKNDEIRGVACLVLAQVLRRRGDTLAASNAKAADKMHQESEKLFEEAADKYAGVKTAFDGPVGKKAKIELYDLRYLSVGKAAPEVKGTDQDGKHFKLSDYKGKVVLLDFWSEF
jgi:AhpC/TSA family